jgi:hypothetical protein
VDLPRFRGHNDLTPLRWRRVLRILRRAARRNQCPARHKGEAVVFQGADVDKPINENSELLIYGAGYGSEAEATSAGTEWVGLIKMALARMNFGADFGERAPKKCVHETRT